MKKISFLIILIVSATLIVSAAMYYYLSGQGTESTFWWQNFAFSDVVIDPTDWSISGFIFLPSSGTASIDIGTHIKNGCIFGSLTSPNAGIIRFDDGTGQSYACIDQNTGKFKTDAIMTNNNLWNISLAWLYFSDTQSNVILPTILTCTDAVATQSLKIIGTVSSANVQEAFSENTISNFWEISRNDFMSRLHKNVALAIRNGWTLTDFPNLVYFNATHVVSTLTPVQKQKDAIVVIWGDLIIDANTDDIGARVYISLQDANWVGGDIYITGTPQLLDWLFIAEKSILSGNGPGDLAVSDCSTYTRQLYVHWGLIGRNTIGWSIVTGADYVCPSYIIQSGLCDKVTARKYDLGFLRYFRLPSLGNPVALADLSAIARSFTWFATIVEVDPSIFTQPPKILLK